MAFCVGTACSYNGLSKQHDNPPMDVSPQCRQNALQLLHNDDFGHAFGERFCHHLSYAQKQLLALELTKCHLDEMQQATFETPCEFSVQECLVHLTPLGFQSYTLFKINVEQYCIKLNHDLMVLQQQETGARLQQIAKLASQQLADLMQQQGEMQHEYSKLYSSLHEEQMELHQNILQQTIERQQDSEQQLLKWMQQIMTGQEKQIQLQRQELQYLSTSVEKTVSHFKPLLNLNVALSWIYGGVQILNLFVYMYITVNLHWLLTLPQCVRSCRRRLCALAVLEFLLQCSFIWLSGDRAKINENFIKHVRVLSHSLQATVYVLSFVSSFFRTIPPATDRELHQELLMLLKNMSNSTNQIQQQIVESDSHMIQLLQEQKNNYCQPKFLQYPPTSHDMEAAPTMVGAKSTEQIGYLCDQHIVADQFHSLDSTSSSGRLMPSHHDEESEEQTFYMHRIRMPSSPTDKTSLQQIPSTDFFVDTISDSRALVRTPPLQAPSNVALSDKKRSRLEFQHDWDTPSKRFCANKTKKNSQVTTSFPMS
jgi:hypothetical protein